MAETEYTRRDIESVAEKEWGRIDIVEAGGGGSGDFSTCTVIITNNTEESITVYVPNAYEYEDEAMASTHVEVGAAQTENVSVILYKGSAYAILSTKANIDTSGNISGDSEGGCLITGDGTITLTSGSPK